MKTGWPGNNFVEAERHCNSIGGHLASIHSEEENVFIKNLVNNSGDLSKRSVWDVMLLIGAERNETEKDYWQYMDGSTFDYNNWGKSEPSNSGGEEDCVVVLGRERIYIGKNKTEWNDISCGFKFPTHICKKPGGRDEQLIEEIQELQKLRENCEISEIAMRRSVTFLALIIMVLLMVLLLGGCHYARNAGSGFKKVMMHEKIFKKIQTTVDASVGTWTIELPFMHSSEGYSIPEQEVESVSGEYLEHCSTSSDGNQYVEIQLK